MKNFTARRSLPLVSPWIFAKVTFPLADIVSIGTGGKVA
jgi:hypothetical protein